MDPVIGSYEFPQRSKHGNSVSAKETTPLLTVNTSQTANAEQFQVQLRGTGAFLALLLPPILECGFLSSLFRAALRSCSSQSSNWHFIHLFIRLVSWRLLQQLVNKGQCSYLLV